MDEPAPARRAEAPLPGNPNADYYEEMRRPAEFRRRMQQMRRWQQQPSIEEQRRRPPRPRRPPFTP